MGKLGGEGTSDRAKTLTGEIISKYKLTYVSDALEEVYGAESLNEFNAQAVNMVVDIIANNRKVHTSDLFKQLAHQQPKELEGYAVLEWVVGIGLTEIKDFEEQVSDYLEEVNLLLPPNN